MRLKIMCNNLLPFNFCYRFMHIHVPFYLVRTFRIKNIFRNLHVVILKVNIIIKNIKLQK